jgi:hypothetical protein
MEEIRGFIPNGGNPVQQRLPKSYFHDQPTTCAGKQTSEEISSSLVLDVPEIYR